MPYVVKDRVQVTSTTTGTGTFTLGAAVTGYQSFASIGNTNNGWDISFTFYDQSFSVFAQESNPQGLFFKPDGLKMYVVGSTNDTVNEYNLSTAWDVSTATYLQNFSISAQVANAQGLFFKPDGLKMYVVDSSGNDVNEYDLSSAWNVTTASYLQNFSVALVLSIRLLFPKLQSLIHKLLVFCLLVHNLPAVKKSSEL
jgi:DNA-binding beta-propeller fold protein YncE